MTSYISYDVDGNEIYQVFDEIVHESINVDHGAVQIDAHNEDGHVVLRGSGYDEETKLLTCFNTQYDPEQEVFSISAEGVLTVDQVITGRSSLGGSDATTLNTGYLAVNGDTHLVGASTFGDIATPTMQINNQGIQIDKELVINDAMLSTGGIALLDDAVLGFKPYDQNGNPTEAGFQFTFGRHAQIGDLSHDNDGICLRSLATVDGVKEAHTVLIAPDPSDPNIVIHSRKNTDFLKFVRCPDDAAQILESDTKFRVTQNGYIESNQMDIIFERLEVIESLLHQLQDADVPLNTPDLEPHVTDNNIAGA